MTNIAIIFASGVANRFQSPKKPKQFVTILGKPLIIHTLENFEHHPEIDKIYVAILPSWHKKFEKMIEKYGLRKIAGIVDGGVSGQESIFNALKKAYEENDPNSLVLIHDGVRPIIDADVILENIKTAEQFGAVATVVPAPETIAIVEGKICSVPLKKNCLIVQAPQTFILKDIYQAHLKIQKMPEKYDNIADSFTMYKKLGKKVFFVKGNTGNIKVTYPEDINFVETLLKRKI